MSDSFFISDDPLVWCGIMVLTNHPLQLGGSGGSETGQYVLGDDALGVLRDIKKWLRHYDEKANRMDVARCLAEAKLVNRDLIPILAISGDEEAMSKNKFQARIALSCCAYLPLLFSGG